MTDAITRQDAAKAIAQDIISKAIDEGWSDYTIAREAALAAINALPAAPDRVAIIEECAKALEADAKLCDCFALEERECACGAWCEHKSITSQRAIEIIRALQDKQ